MRRVMPRIALLLLAALALDWTPGLPPKPVPVASAQFGITGPGGVVNYTTASVTCTNTTAACTLYSTTVPAGLMATGSIASSTTIGTPPGLHLIMLGTLNTPSSGQIGTINLGANFGGSTATLTLLNGHTPAPPGALTTVPIQIDVWISDIATATTANTVWLRGRVAYVAASGTETVVNSQVLGTTALNVAQTLAVNWNWGSASNTNALNLYNQQLIIGN